MLLFLEQAVDSGNKDAKRFATQSFDIRRITNMPSMAKCEILIRSARLDSVPFLMNFLNATVDLCTGPLRPHQRNDHITRLVHFNNYVPTAELPVFEAFLARITGLSREAKMRLPWPMPGTPQCRRRYPEAERMFARQASMSIQMIEEKAAW